MSLKLKLTMAALLIIGLLGLCMIKVHAQQIPPTKPSEYLGNCIINFTWLQEQKSVSDQANLGLLKQIEDLKKKCGKACEEKSAK